MSIQDFLIPLLAASVIAGTPILYAALGEVITERAGIINLGVEGIMLVGAVTGFMAAVSTSNPWIGLLVSMAAGGAIAVIHAFLTITLRANQVVSGLALTIFGTGFSGYLGKAYIGIPVPKPFDVVPLGPLADIPFIGPVFFQHDALVYISYALVILIWYFMFHTRPGLNLRALGENPAAMDALGLNVFALRYIYVITGGALGGIGGAYLSLAYAPSWLENMTAGRGWIAVALVIFALWNPWRALLGAYLFGGIDALGFRLQVLGIQMSPFFLKMLPYLFTVIILVFVVARQKGRLTAPGALGLAYDREER
ncbi:putative ABC-type transport system, permease component [Desulfosporosinus orientis DSM 765]|uniref:Putative ABC-type transport system, permease component n=1 Tax=Desulfosporosinus orientis (strain ATCC 19365 / DSM 765 / NCIMB 8382 / VKM B-1628 / Singapore I) TaxID=768706 RepID=G7WBZ3_DESOD|nr:ABC transporter permease [Desulfosporosinus orientis]AET69967.1 putative ABC-type transport system, permease component [Desulfosporosinus orientis DSM 765]